MTAPFVETLGISKAFGGVQALTNVSLSFYPEEVHGLVGANGAGKSTLVRILAGVHQPDAGEIRVNGEPVHIPNTLAARNLGLAFIHQELSLVPKFTVLQNLSLGLVKPSRFGMVNWAPIRLKARPVADRLRFAFSLDVQTDTLSVANRWLVLIARALIQDAKLLAMDEPTASLSADEVNRLFEIIRDLRAGGTSIIYVSHRLEEIQEICDRVSIFRDGHHTMTLDRTTMTRQALVEGIIGGSMPEPSETAARHITEKPRLVLRNMVRLPSVRGVSLAVAPGEVVGLAGLVGAGRTELARLVFGADRPDSGEIILDGKPVHPKTPSDASKLGIALVPEERRQHGLFLQQSVSFNVNLASLSEMRPIRALPFLSPSLGERRAQRVVDDLEIKTPSVLTVVGNLSGGNQQKVVVGKWLAKKPVVLILDEPTRGVDVRARGEIHRTIRRLADDGMSILMIASELEELLICDRVLVMREGVLVGELVGTDISLAHMLALSYGETDPQSKPTE